MLRPSQMQARVNKILLRVGGKIGILGHPLDQPPNHNLDRGPVAWMARLEPRCAAVVAVLGRPLGARGACKSRRCRATSSISRISTASGSAPPPIWLCPRPKPQCKVALAKPPPFSPAFFSREIIFTQNKSTGSPVQQLLLEVGRSFCFQIETMHLRARIYWYVKFLSLSGLSNLELSI